MNMSLEEARQKEEAARLVVSEKAAARKEAQRLLLDARDALRVANETRAKARDVADELRAQLRETRAAITPSEAANVRALGELDSAKARLEAARVARGECEERLVVAEANRDEAERLLAEAQFQLDSAGMRESSARADLDHKVQRATDAQREFDVALTAIEDARNDVKRIEGLLRDARADVEALPTNDDPLERVVREREGALQRAVAKADKAQQELDGGRQQQKDAEVAAADAKRAYEQAQANLRTAIAASDKAEAQMNDARRLQDLGPEGQKRQADALAAYAAANDVRSAAMTVNAQALTALADADVEAIRVRLACEAAAVALDDANAVRARAERELREAQQAVEHAALERRERDELVQRRAAELQEAKSELERLEIIGAEAAEENAAAQEGLRDIQDIAIQNGKASRDAAGTLDERRHALSDTVSGVELARNELVSAREYEHECADGVEAAKAVAEVAGQKLADAQRFIEDAQKRIAEQQEVMRAAEQRAETISLRYRKADEMLSLAQRELDVANADLTDAEVAIIMAQIDSRAE